MFGTANWPRVRGNSATNIPPLHGAERNLGSIENVQEIKTLTLTKKLSQKKKKKCFSTINGLEQLRNKFRIIRIRIEQKIHRQYANEVIKKTFKKLQNKATHKQLIIFGLNFNDNVLSNQQLA